MVAPPPGGDAYCLLTHDWWGCCWEGGGVAVWLTPTFPPPFFQVVNNVVAGVVEPAMSKVKSLRFATEAAITVLRVDDYIKVVPASAGGQQQH